MTLMDALGGAYRKILTPSGGCHNCPRRKVDFVPPTLKQTKLIFVGEAPGATDVTEQVGFSGKTGEKLRQHLTAVGITDFSFTSAIHCRPPNNGAPKPKELACCLSQFVLGEIADYPIVVTCGGVPLNALFPGVLASHYRGNIAHHPDFPGQRFYNIYHPNYILRRPDLEGDFRQDIERLARIVAGEPPVPWTVHQGGTERMWAALHAALASPLISLDFETSSLDPWLPGEHIRSTALTANGLDVVFAHEGEPHWRKVLHLIQLYLEQPQKAVVGNNIGFDLDWIEHENEFTVQVTSIHEISVIYYQAKQYKMATLKELASRELDGYRYLVYEPSLERDLNLLANYNAEDVIYPLQLLRKGLRLLKPVTRDLVTRVLGPASLPLRQITTAGFYLRRDYRTQKIEEYQDKRRAAVEAWRQADPEFIPTTHETGNGLSTYLFEIRKLPVLSRTETDKAATDQPSIKQWIRDGATYLTHLLDMKEYDKILSTYLLGYDKHLGFDSRVHSDYTQTYVDSGRTSSRNPNLQNIPREKEIRDLFGCTPGGTLIEADLSQIEFRIMVCLAKDETGIAAYLRGEDAHTTTAKNFSPTPTKEQRNQAKPINFSLIYGGTWLNVQRVAQNDYGLNWPEELCKDFTKIFFATYKRFPEFHAESQAKLIRNRGWFESIVGHVFHYHEWDHADNGRRDHTFRSALNSEAQGPAAQICFAIMVYVRRLLNANGMKTVRFVNTVHDSIIVDIPAGILPEDVIAQFQAAVALAYEWVKPWFIIPLTMDYKIGESWGSMTDYHLGS